MAIGESSNLAQLCLTYSYNFDDKKFTDYVCILSVLAQIAIDSAKRRFDINVSNEIKRIKQDIDVKNNGYPVFWTLIHSDFNKNRINKDLKCPMNYLYNIKIKKFKELYKAMPMSVFFKKFELERSRTLSRKVEELIQDFSLDLLNWSTDDELSRDEKQYLLLRSDFENLIERIQTLYISNSYIGLMSWLIDRAFLITPTLNLQPNNSTMNENKAILLKTLYSVNPKNLLKCFSGNLQK